jgi:glycosyltransferase involved in cell wall biosynthesis
MIGVGIITCNRVDFLAKLVDSLPPYIDRLVIVDDANNIPLDLQEKITADKSCSVIIQNSSNKQVGECKNIAMTHLLDANCDYIFTLEDDILVKDPDVFKKYIDASIETGIQHMNFGFSQRENLCPVSLNPVYRKTIEYPKGAKIILTKNILGAFTFYTRKALQTIGLHHYRFNKGHGDHPELTYRAYKHGFTTPFWWFADIYDSWNMIENQSNMGSDSLVRNQEKFAINFSEANDLFEKLHGHKMLATADVGEQEVLKCLQTIYHERKK